MALHIESDGPSLLDPVGASGRRASAPRAGQDRPALTVVIPAFDEAPRLGETLRELRRTLDTRYLRPYEVVVVDDGSTDRTFEVACAAAEQWTECRVISYATNEGKGGALRRGVQSARGHVVAFFDADGDIFGATLLQLLDDLRNASDVAAVVGRRQWLLPRPWHRRLASGMLSRFSRHVLGIRVPETQAGVKVFRRAELVSAASRCVEQGYLFDLELLAHMQRQGCRLVSVDIRQLRSRPSRIGVWEGVHELLPAIRIWRRLGTATSLVPPRVASPPTWRPAREDPS